MDDKIIGFLIGRELVERNRDKMSPAEPYDEYETYVPRKPHNVGELQNIAVYIAAFVFGIFVIRFLGFFAAFLVNFFVDLLVRFFASVG